ncbi:DUF3617 family protein [Chitinimonas arctica]|uniref:DUF3617 family protein n=1 Tax=Chitinimonas arctica TaxID=2594795 RepID=A0A516SD48_9NEIS|nr:DUF3617 family protein [Chitinimonas arctica]QDQ26077.1 DUF3617 family protein [Chitinimonas arctica]
MQRAFAVGLFCLAAQSVFAAPQPSAGQWEITTTVNMPGMNMKIPPQTVKFCLKPEDVKDHSKQMGAPQGQASKDCKMLENSISGDTVKYRMRCEGKQVSDISGEVSYGSNSYKGHTDITTSGPQGKMQMKNEFTAKRLGDC